LLIVAAILAGRGEISFTGLFLSAWAGAVIGDNIGYLLGRLLGRKLVWHYGSKVGLSPERLRRVEAVFARYGPATVGFARFVNVLRQLNGIVAGTVGMDWRPFLMFNALGGALWVLTWLLAGYYFGSHGADMAAIMHGLGFLGAFLSLAVPVLIVAAVFGYRILGRRRRRRGRGIKDS
jgi:membrane protein DedA with SNARE-associated domain